MITKEVDVENLRDGNVIMIGDWGGRPGIKVRVHRVLKFDQGCGDILYEVLVSGILTKKMETLVYPKGYKKTLIF